MKRIKVVCNPFDNKIKFPADVVNFLADDDNHSWEKFIKEWAVKNKKFVLRTDVEYIVDVAKEAVKGEKI